MLFETASQSIPGDTFGDGATPASTPTKTAEQSAPVASSVVTTQPLKVQPLVESYGDVTLTINRSGTCLPANGENCTHVEVVLSKPVTDLPELAPVAVYFKDGGTTAEYLSVSLLDDIRAALKSYQSNSEESN